MTTVVTSMRFACRRRTAADWTSGNEILLAGEIGYETDTDKFKIGDGVTRWNSISGYFSKTGGSGSAAWGAITGTLADQTDLATALALKVPTSRTVNGLALSANITLSASDVGADASGAAAAAQAYAIQRANHTGTQAQSTITNLVSDLALKADLVGGVVPSAQIPAIAITEFLGSVANQSAMLALLGQRGDWCIRTDLSMVYVITGTDPTQLSDWTGMAYPTAPVLSVNGHTGAVTLAPSDLGLVIGTNVQAYDADLAAIAALSPSANDVLQFKSGAWANRTMAQLASDLGVPALSSANTWTAQNIFAPSGSLTANAPMTYSATWNNGAIDFEGLLVSITATAAASTSSPIRVKVGGATVFSVRKDGLVVAALGFGSANQYWDFSGTPAYKFFGTTALSLSSGSLDLNAMNFRMWAGYRFVVGGTIPTYASAATIGPINSVVAFVSGTSAIDTITSAISSGSSTAQIVHLMPTAAWTWTTAGNIAVAGTAVVGKLLTMVYSKATDKWYPSYT